jgi:hypothetical protein
MLGRSQQATHDAQTLGTARAVKAGLTDHIWTVEEIVGLLEAQELKSN